MKDAASASERSLILETAARWFLPILLIFSVFLLLRGHNAPGGGFVGGLVAAAAYALSAFASGVQVARRRLYANPKTLISLGLLCSAFSGVPGLLVGDEFLRSFWFTVPIPLVGEWKTGTVFLFDCGVYLTVLGMMMLVLFSALEDGER